MDSNMSVAEVSIIPSELTGQLPRRTRLAKNGIVSVILLTILLVVAGALSFRPGMNAMQEMQTRAALRDLGSDAVGKVGRTRGYYLDYSFTVDGRSFTGHALMPDRIRDSSQDYDPLLIRYLPSNPAINRPAGWEESDPAVWLSLLLPILLLLISAVMLVWMRIDRRLAAEGTPAVAVVTKCTVHGRGTNTFNYEFRTEDGRVIEENSQSYSLQEIGARICVLYLPQNPRRNLPYSSLGYRVSQ